MDNGHVDMAAFLVRERDANLAAATKYAELPQLVARFRGMANGLDMAISWLAGLEGYGDRELFETALAELIAASPATALAVRFTATPRDAQRELRHVQADLAASLAAALAGGPDDPDDDDEPALRELDRDPQLGGIDAVTMDAFRQAELDTQAEPMGGWEPRS